MPHRPRTPNTKSAPPPRPQPAATLRLHRDGGEETQTTTDLTYKFPAGVSTTGPKTLAGRRLIAATVAEAPVERSFEGSPCAVVNGGDDPDCLGRIVSSGQLVREIEHTLDRMQSRLSRFRDEVDNAFQFPDPSHRDLPPAA